MITADQLVAHAIGDYVLQSQHLAENKRSSWRAAAIHAILYALPFLLITRSPAALTVIVVTHTVIDRLGLARYLVWLKNTLIAPPAEWHGWTGVAPTTGYPWTVPIHLAAWLTIIVDNLLHVVINAVAIQYL